MQEDMVLDLDEKVKVRFPASSSSVFLCFSSSLFISSLELSDKKVYEP